MKRGKRKARKRQPLFLNLEGLDISEDVMKELLSVDKELWLEDCKGIREFYKQVGDRVPTELYDELAALEARLSK